MRLESIIGMLSGRNYKKCLDIGFGSGILFPALSRKSRDLFGAEVHDKIVEVKNSRGLEKINLKLLKSSVLNLSFKDNSFDLIICASVLEHIHDLKKAFSEIKRILANNGELIVSVPCVSRTMSFIFKSFLRVKDIDCKHVSSHVAVEKILRSEFIILDFQKIRLFPLLPPMYYCFLARRK